MSDNSAQRFSQDLVRLIEDFEDYLKERPERTADKRAVVGGVSVTADSGTVDQSGYRVPKSSPRNVPESDRVAELRDIERKIHSCRLCRLAEGRHNAVPGTGVLDPLVMVIGEGPGADEDRTGEPFVGKAGQYLDKWLEAIDLDRNKNVYIANIVKCRPPGNRDPQTDEAETCMPYLFQQIDVIRPRTILTVGRVSIRFLLGRDEAVGKLRGRTFDFRSIPVIPTYHPSGVLRNPDLRRPVWEDLKRLRQIIDGDTDLPANTT
jgi:uracil-DNA glycosylase